MFLLEDNLKDFYKFKIRNQKKIEDIYPKLEQFYITKVKLCRKIMKKRVTGFYFLVKIEGTFLHNFFYRIGMQQYQLWISEISAALIQDFHD